MSQFRRFNTSDSQRSDSTAAYPQGVLTWDTVNGLRLHDGTTAGGNPIGSGGGGDRLVNGLNEVVLGANGSITFPNNTVLTPNTSLTVQTKLSATYGPFNGVYFESGNGSVNGVHSSGYAGYFFITTVNLNNDGTYSASGYPVSIQNGTNPTYTISGVDLGGTSPANDCVLSVTTVNDAITNISASGTPFLPKWTYGADGTLTLPNGTNIYGDGIFQADAVGGFELNSFTDNIGGGKKTWTFGTDGNLTLPNGMTIDSYGTLGVNAFVNIGGDNTRISIDNNGAPPGLYITTDAAGTPKGWLFDSDGTLTVPGKIAGVNGNLDLNYDGSIVLASQLTSVPVVIQTTDSIYTNLWAFQDSGTLTLPNGNLFVSGQANGETNIQVIDTTNSFKIYTHANSNAKMWEFGADGNLTIPGEIKSTANTGPVIINSTDGNTTKTWTFGADGTTTFPGRLMLPKGYVDIVTPSEGTGDKSIDIYTNEWNGGGVEVYLEHDNGVGIYTDNGNYGWLFDKTGNLTVPGNILTSNALNVTTNIGVLLYSSSFDGTQYMEFADAANLKLGDSTAFTIECWVYETQYYPAKNAVIIQKGGQKSVSYATYQLTLANDTVIFNTGTGGGGANTGGKTVNSSTPLPLNQWVHVAVVWDGTNINLYQNGVNVGTTAADPLEMGDNSGSVTIGTIAGGGENDNFVGKISNLRIVKNTPVYTGAFTPSTTPLTSIANTSLLTCNSNTVVINETAVNDSPWGPNSNRTWAFGTDGKLTLPDAGIVKVGVDTAQIGSTQAIADDGSGGLVGWSSQALSIAYDSNVISTYPVGSTITWQDGSTATITGYDDYGPTYIDIFWDTPKTGTLFPIILKTANYAAATTAPEWTFDADGGLSFPQGSTITETTTTTIISPPGASAGQSLVIRPTAGGVDPEASHIHLVAGNPTTVDLYLGDDDQYVKIEKNGGNVVIGTNADTKKWTFNQGGSLEVPAGSIITTPTSLSIYSTGETPGGMELGSGNASFYVYNGILTIITNNQNGQAKVWTWDDTGNITFPDGGTLRMATAPTTSKGASGDKAGMLAVDSTSIFYCIADYDTGATDIWVKQAWGTTGTW